LILVDTSVWIDHLKVGSEGLARLLDDGEVLGHPWVAGELALGGLRQRREVIRLLAALPQATVATPKEVMVATEQHELHGAGIGYVDAQLVAATMLTSGAELWTNDRRLRDVSSRLRRAFEPAGAGEGAR